MCIYIYAVVSQCCLDPVGAGLWHEGSAPTTHCYEELVVQPKLTLFITNEDNQGFPFCDIAVHLALPIGGI